MTGTNRRPEHVKIMEIGNSIVTKAKVQWLRLHTPNEGG